MFNIKNLYFFYSGSVDNKGIVFFYRKKFDIGFDYYFLIT